MRTGMRRTAAVLTAAALCLTAAACTGSEDEKPSAAEKTKAAKESAPVQQLSVDRLKAGTLTVKDLPAGYATMKAPEADLAFTADKKQCQPLAGLMNEDFAGAVMGERADFADAIGGQLSHQVFSFKGAGSADFVQKIGAALASCTAFTAGVGVGEGEDGMKIKIEKLKGPSVGEESHSFRLIAEVPSMKTTFDSELLVAREGTGVTRLVQTTVGGGDGKDFTDLSERAGAKFVKAARG